MSQLTSNFGNFLSFQMKINKSLCLEYIYIITNDIIRTFDVILWHTYVIEPYRYSNGCDEYILFEQVTTI